MNYQPHLQFGNLHHYQQKTSNVEVIPEILAQFWLTIAILPAIRKRLIILLTISTLVTQKNAIYLLDCTICQKQYIGETGTTVKVRMKHHRNKFKGKTDLSIYHHPLTHNADFSKLTIILNMIGGIWWKAEPCIPVGHGGLKPLT